MWRGVELGQMWRGEVAWGGMPRGEVEMGGVSKWEARIDGSHSSFVHWMCSEAEQAMAGVTTSLHRR